MNKQLLLILKLARYGFWILAVSSLVFTSTTASVIIASVMFYIWIDVAATLFFHRKLGIIEYNSSVLLWPFK